MTRRSYLKEAKYTGVRSKASAKSLSGKLWPTGEFSFGRVPARPDERLDDRPVEICLPADEYTAAAPTGGNGAKAPAPLDLSNVRNSDSGAKRPETYGRNGITGYGKKMLKSLGALIDREFPTHRVTFATVTLPPVTPEKRRELALLWSEFVSQLFRKLSRILDRQGLPRVVCSSTEIQTKRLQAYGEAVLHLHVLWLNRPGRAGNWAVDVESLKTWCKAFWVRRGILSEDDYLNIDVRAVKGNKANYLAKYVSKGTEEIQALAEQDGWEAVPRQWWNMTRTAREWVKANVLQGGAVGELLHQWLNWAWDYDNFELYRYVYQVEMNLDGVLVNVGWRGCFWSDAMQLFIDSMHAQEVAMVQGLTVMV